jgi:hypothetical protein
MAQLAIIRGDLGYVEEAFVEHNFPMALCSNCGSTYSSFIYSGCPECKGKPLSVSEKSKNSKLKMEDSPKAISNISHSGEVAIQSARIVNAYGTYIQVAGIVLGAVIAILGIWLATKLENNSVIFIASIASGLIVAGVAAVQGALFRMFSNYVIARLED